MAKKQTKQSKATKPKTQTSQVVNEILNKDAEKFQSFEKAKDAYNYFVGTYPKMREFVTYDNFHYYWTKRFPNRKLATLKETFGVNLTKRTMPKQMDSAPVNTDSFKQEDDFDVVPYKPVEDNTPDELFVGLRTGKFLDFFVSSEGGFMPATTNVIFSDGGVGKSTIGFDALYSIQQKSKKLDCMAFSAEMSRTDLKAEVKQGKEWMDHVPQVLMDDYKAEQYVALLKKVVLHGYDFLVIDSFQTILEKLCDKCYMNRNQAKNFILQLCKDANDGKTKTGKHTAIFLIQQVNKDGNFVGANALKHDTTGMMFAKFDDHGDRYLMYIKNRRNGKVVKKKLYYTLNDKNEVVYDEKRWMEDREREDVARKSKQDMEKSKEEFMNIFTAKTNKRATAKASDDVDLEEDDDFDEFAGEDDDDL